MIQDLFRILPVANRLMTRSTRIPRKREMTAGMVEGGRKRSPDREVAEVAEVIPTTAAVTAATAVTAKAAVKTGTTGEGIAPQTKISGLAKEAPVHLVDGPADGRVRRESV